MQSEKTIREVREVFKKESNTDVREDAMFAIAVDAALSWVLGEKPDGWRSIESEVKRIVENMDEE